MKVILTEKVKSLGTIGEIVNVSAGFARNYLLPRQFAMIADDKNSNVLKDKQKALAKKIGAERDAAVAIKTKLEGMTVELIKKVGANGRLFGAVTSSDVAKELEKAGVSVERRLLSFDGSIKSLGTYEVKAKLFNDVTATFNLKVAIDAAMAAELKKQQEEAQKRNADKKAKAEAAKVEAAAAAEAAANGTDE
jgi:large subunit ribosomal protein L9